MLKNYLRVAFRSLKNRKHYTRINILGLTLGITVCIIIFLLISFETSFEDVHSKRDHIYRIVQQRSNNGGINYNANTPYPLTEAIRLELPQFSEVTAIHYEDNVLVSVGDDKYTEDKIIFADSLFLQVFNFGVDEIVLEGDIDRTLSEPNFIAISEEIAQKYFKDENPLGKTIKFNNKLELEVGAILKNSPENTHLRYNMLVSLKSLNSGFKRFNLDKWDFVASGSTYILLPENVNPAVLEQNFTSLIEKYYPEDLKENIHLSLQPLSEIHFDQVYNEGLSTVTVDKQYLYVLFSIGVFVILIACINFINLSTAIGFKKSKEIGVRKVLGALRSSLIFQTISESFIIASISGIISIILAMALLPVVADFLDKEISADPVNNIFFWSFLLGLVILITAVAGIYPALVISGYKPIEALKNKMTFSGKASLKPRHSLIMLQFLVAQFLVIVTLIISSQVNFLITKPLGFQTDAIINIDLPTTDSLSRAVFYEKLIHNNDFKNITFNMAAPFSTHSLGIYFYETAKGDVERYDINLKSADPQYDEVYDIKVVAGRWFRDNDLRTPEVEYIINEKAAETLGYDNLEDIIGRKITTGFGNLSGEIIGVTEDFHLKSLHDPIVPLVFVYYPPFFQNAGIEMTAGVTDIDESILQIKNTWSELYPDDLFRYDFMDDQVYELYSSDMKIFNLFKIFSGIAIIISCLGVYGLVSFMIEQKRKEISIRKVIGASVSNIIILFSKDFLKLLIIAFLLSAPIAFYFSDRWLENFAYKDEMSIWSFVAGGVIVAVIALTLISFQSIKASIKNPVQYLSNE